MSLVVPGARKHSAAVAIIPGTDIYLFLRSYIGTLHLARHLSSACPSQVCPTSHGSCVLVSGGSPESVLEGKIFESYFSCRTLCFCWINRLIEPRSYHEEGCWPGHQSLEGLAC